MINVAPNLWAPGVLPHKVIWYVRVPADRRKSARRRSGGANGLFSSNQLCSMMWPPASATLREEVFVPVLCALHFESETGVTVAANDTPYPLTGSVWTRHLLRTHRMAAEVAAGLFGVNDHGRPDVAIPFGGFGLNGWARARQRPVRRSPSGRPPLR